MKNCLVQPLLSLALISLFAASFGRATGGDPLVLTAGAASSQEKSRKAWRVPTRKARLANPVQPSVAVLAAGKEVYKRECATCHGAIGRGDGPGAAEVQGGVRAFQDVGLAVQSGGALFYKILTGRDPMPGYRRLLAEEEIWGVVHYLRVLAPLPLSEPRFRASAEQREGVSSVLAHYVATTRALASGDAASARRNATELVDLASSPDSPGLAEAAVITDDQREAWEVDLTALLEAARELASVPALADQRKIYATLSDAMCRLVDDFGHAEPEPLRLLQSSEGGKPRTWLDSEVAPKDPYTSEGEAEAQSARTARLLAGRPGPPSENRLLETGG